MKTSDMQPTSWAFGTSNPKVSILMRKWNGIRENVAHMEEVMLKLMSNPQTTPEQMALVAKAYSNVTQRLNDTAHAIDAYLYNGTKPKTFGTHMLSCAATRSGNEEDCNCKDWQTED
jgi:hypothetical protein